VATLFCNHYNRKNTWLNVTSLLMHQSYWDIYGHYYIFMNDMIPAVWSICSQHQTTWHFKDHWHKMGVCSQWKTNDQYASVRTLTTTQNCYLRYWSDDSFISTLESRFKYNKNNKFRLAFTWILLSKVECCWIVLGFMAVSEQKFNIIKIINMK